MTPATTLSRDYSILLIEDDPQLCNVMVQSFKDLGISILTSNRMDEAIQLYKEKMPNLIIIDVEEDSSQLNFVEAIKDKSQTEIVLLRSNRLNDELRSQLKPTDVIYKPFDTRYLCRRVVELLS